MGESQLPQPAGQGPFEPRLKAAASPSARQPLGLPCPSPPPLHCPGLAASRPWGAWASFKRAETTNGPRLCLTSPLGEFEGKQNAAGLLITGRGVGGEAPWGQSLQCKPQPGPCPSHPSSSISRSLTFPIFQMGTKTPRADVEAGLGGARNPPPPAEELARPKHSVNRDGCSRCCRCCQRALATHTVSGG